MAYLSDRHPHGTSPPAEVAVPPHATGRGRPLLRPNFQGGKLDQRLRRHPHPVQRFGRRKHEQTK